MTAHAGAIATTFAIYLFVGASCWGWGRWVSDALPFPTRARPFGLMWSWLGWAVILLVLQFLHLFFPLTAYVVFPVLALGVLLPRLPPAKPPRDGTGDAAFPRWSPAIIFMGAFIAYWIASRSMLSPTNYDSGLYHFNSIRWINSYPIVAGLGNLHGRLAFNQSGFTFVAALNFHPFFGHGRSLANGFLWLLLTASVVSCLRAARRTAASGESPPVLEYAPALLAIPVLAGIALSSDGFASPTPDLTATIVQLVMFILFARFWSDRLQNRSCNEPMAMILLFLAATAVTVKLSNLGYAAAMACCVLFYAGQTPRRRAAGILRIAGLPLALMVIWMTRGVILSGAPFYPSPIGYIPSEWAIPKNGIQTMSNWIFSWARKPHTPWYEVVGNWQWFNGWMNQMKGKTLEVVFPVVAALILCLLALMAGLWSCRRRGRPFRAVAWAILFPPLLGLGFWFFTAPDIRFAHAQFIILTMSAALLFLTTVSGSTSRRAFRFILGLVFLFSNLHFFGDIRGHLNQVKAISVSGWHPLPHVPLRKYRTRSGLEIYTPQKGKQTPIWDAPLLTSPRQKDNLRLRRPGHIASGFMTEK